MKTALKFFFILFFTTNIVFTQNRISDLISNDANLKLEPKLKALLVSYNRHKSENTQESQEKYEAIKKTLLDNIYFRGEEKIDVVFKIEKNSYSDFYQTPYLEGQSLHIGENYDYIATTISINNIESILNLKNLIGIEPSHILFPLLHRSIPEIKADRVWGGDNAFYVDSITGKGVYVGIIDTKPDTSHVTFKSNAGISRINELYNYPTGQPADTHGTHVGGIASGNGEDNSSHTHRGVAFKSDLLFGNFDLNDVSGFGGSNGLINSFQDMINKAQNDNKPLVVNASVGVRLHPNDGTTFFEEILDSKIENNIILVVAAGNEREADRFLHIKKNVNIGAEELITIQLYDDKWFEAEFWYNSASNLQISIRKEGGTWSNWISLGEETIYSLTSGINPEKVHIFNNHTSGFTTNSDNKVIRLEFFRTLLPLNPGNYEITLKNAGNENIIVDGYNSFKVGNGEEPHISFINGDQYQSLTIPASCKEAITVAAWNLSGNLYPPSSFGPLRTDGENLVSKPDISAPGVVLSSVPNSAWESQGGTSMATPHVTGAIALLLENFPQLTATEIKSILKESAAPIPNGHSYSNGTLTLDEMKQWGAGKLNVLSAYKYMVGYTYNSTFIFKDKFRNAYNDNEPILDGLPIEVVKFNWQGNSNLYVQRMTDGVVFYEQPNPEAFWIGGWIWNKWIESGGVNSILGLPKSKEYVQQNSRVVNFEYGKIIFNGINTVIIIRPTLSDGNVSPVSGSTSSIFNFSVIYKNKNNLPPDPNSIKVFIDNVGYVMSKNPNTNNWITGVNYLFNSSANQFNNGQHNYYFTGSYQGEPIENDPPTGFKSFEVSSNPSGGQLTLTANPSTIQYDGSSASTVTATVKNSNGVPLSGISVDFIAYGGINPTPVITNFQGKASTTFTPNHVGLTPIEVITSNGLNGIVNVNVLPGGSGTFTIDMQISVDSRTENSVTYKFNPYVVYTSNNQCVEGETITLTSSLGTFQNGLPTLSDMLGDGGFGCGRIEPLPLLTCTSSGLATINVIVGPTTKIFTIDATLGLIPVVQPILTLSTNSSTLIEETERNVHWSKDGKYLATAKGLLFKVPSFNLKYSLPNLDAPTISLSKSGRKLLMGRFSDNPVFYIYDSGNNQLNQYNPSNIRTNSICWSDTAENIKFALANKISGKCNEIILFEGEGFIRSYLYTDDANDVILSIDWKEPYLAATTEAGAIYLFNTNSKIRIWKSTIGRTWKYSCSISKDKTKLAVLGRLYTGFNNLYVFNINSSNPIGQYATYNGNSRFYSVDWSPDGNQLLVAGDAGRLKILNASNGNEQYALNAGSADIMGVSWGENNLISAIDPNSTYIFAPNDIEGPEITWNYPLSNQTTQFDTINVIGKIYDLVGIQSAEIKVNDGSPTTINLDDDGNFNLNINLPFANNNLTIKATDRGGKFSQLSRTVYKVTIPTTPILVSPIDSSFVFPDSINFNWHSSSSATSYHLQVSNIPSFSNLIFEENNISDTTFVIYNLASGESFYWRVRAKNSIGESSFSIPYFFNSIPNVPLVPSLYLPANNSVNVSQNPLLIWYNSLRSESYNIQVGLDSLFSIIVKDTLISDTLLFLNNLQPLTYYYWHIKANNIIGSSSWSEAWKFKTRVPLPQSPNLLLPLANSKKQPLSVGLVWNKLENTSTYLIQVSKSLSFQNFVVNDSSVIDTSKAVDSLEDGIKYFWRVKGFNQSGWGSFSVPFNFTTLIKEPVSLTAVSLLHDGIDLMWEDKSNYENGFIIERKDTLAPFTQIGIALQNQITFRDTFNLMDSTRYSYKIYAFNDLDTSLSSNIAEVEYLIPVELTNFSANIDQTIINFFWSTATEKNNSGFEVQRKIKDDWSSLGFVSGYGTTTEIKNYSFTDNLKYFSYKGIIQYRLKQIDYDGNETFSDIIELEVDFTPKEYILYQNYPNPFNPSTTIKFALPFDSKVKLEIYNVLGERISTLINDKYYEVGYHDFNFDQPLASYVYIYRLIAESFTGKEKFIQSKKMVYLK